jgi:putative intracellular protease/amidase/YHS domain-containing protein
MSLCRRLHQRLSASMEPPPIFQVNRCMQRKENMNRRDLLKSSAALGLTTVLPTMAAAKAFGGSGTGSTQTGEGHPIRTSNPLVPPVKGGIPVAFPISRGAQVIDFCGPWEVLQDVQIPGRDEAVFQLYTVATTFKPIVATGGLTIVPDYTFETAPTPKVIVIPAQDGATEPMLEWIRQSTKTTDVTMSVCTGAFVLARTGLLAGKSATTFHQAFDNFAMQYPNIHLKRGVRFVEDGNLATSGGLTAGMDLAFRVVERYFGREVTEKLAFQIEYQGKGWMNAASNEIYADYEKPKKAATGPLCPVCSMEGNPSISSSYKGKTYYFCMQDHKLTFDESPAEFAKAT